MRTIVSADITFKDYYHKFIENSKSEVAKLNNETIAINAVIDRLHQCIIPRRGDIRINYGLTLDRYIEFKTKEYNPELALYKRVRYLYNKQNQNDNDRDLNNLLNYVQALAKKNEIKIKLEYAIEKVNMTYNKYQEYVFEYYNKVQSVLLMGDAYKFNNGIGSISINRFKVTKRPIRIDIKETNNNYKKIIAEGKTPYNEAMAEWCKEHGYKYDGVKYKVNRIVNHVYRIYINETDKRYKCKMSFISANYINTKYRKSNYQEIVDTYCKTFEDIFKLQVSIDIKLKLLLIKFPGYFVNFVRDVNKQ